MLVMFTFHGILVMYSACIFFLEKFVAISVKSWAKLALKIGGLLKNRGAYCRGIDITSIESIVNLKFWGA